MSVFTYAKRFVFYGALASLIVSPVVYNIGYQKGVAESTAEITIADTTAMPDTTYEKSLEELLE